MDRAEVYQAIDSEREYQLRRWGIRQPDGTFRSADREKAVECFICYMEEYLQAARKRVSREAGAAGALEELRKIVALGVACFEVHGAEKRSLEYITSLRDGLPAGTCHTVS